MIQWIAIKALLGPIGDFILKYWKPLAIGALVLGNYLQWTWYWPGKLDEEKAKYAVLEEDYKVCEASRAELKHQVEDTNQKIQQWSDISQKLQKQQDQLNAELKKLRTKSATEVREILNAPTPKTCADVHKYLEDDKGLRWPSK